MGILHNYYYQEPMSAAKPREGAYNFNESCAPDIVSGSLPYMECVFTNCTLVDSGLVSEASQSRPISCSRFPYMAW